MCAGVEQGHVEFTVLKNRDLLVFFYSLIASLNYYLRKYIIYKTEHARTFSLRTGKEKLWMKKR